MRVAHLNARSLIPHFAEIRQLIHENGIEIMCITETWLNDNIPADAVYINGFELYREDRCADGSRGGGVCVYVSNTCKIKVSKINSPKRDSFEQLWLKISGKNINVALGTIYRPPGKNVAMFIDQLDDTLSNISPSFEDIFILGDININLFNLNNPLDKCLDAYGMSQILDEPTRIAKNTQTLIDPIYVSNLEVVTSHGTINADMISDHRLVYCNINYPVVNKQKKIIKIRDFKHFNYNSFLNDLNDIPWNNMLYTQSIDQKVDFLNKNIISLFDKHAPIKTIRVSKPKAPWLTDVVKIMIKERNKALEKYKKSKSIADWVEYKHLRNYTLAAIRREKKAYINDLFRDGGDKKGWQGLRSLGINVKNKITLPENLANPEQINTFFSSFLTENNNSCIDMITYYNGNKHPSNKTFTFKLVTPEDIENNINSIKSNAYGSDSISLNMIKYCLPSITPYLTHIINFCLEEGCFPNVWKQAIIQPIPKINNPATLSDLRPISVLPTLSKILEKIMYKQMNDYLTENNLLPDRQSGFRKYHSTTTTLLNVTDDIINAIDKQKITALVLLDLSKAFDTVNHGLLCSKLKYLGFDEISLSLFKAYFCNRSQKVVINGEHSSFKAISSGVPQGSVLGPLLFLIYTADMFNKVTACKLQGYADDLQMYHSFKVGDAKEAQDIINEDLAVISEYATTHNLKLNASKSYFMLFGSSKHISSVPVDFSLSINNENIPYTKKCKNLGVLLDSDLRFVDHVNNLIRKGYYVLRLLYANKHVLNFNLKKRLCELLVFSIFSYADIVYGPCIDSVTRNRIQKIQNSCCRLVFGLRKFDRVTNNLKILRWLPMQQIWEVHLVTFVHRLLFTHTPSYLHEKLESRTNLHNVNIRHSKKLSIPKHTTAMFQRSFSYVSVKKYNEINDELKKLACATFKCKVREKYITAFIS